MPQVYAAMSHKGGTGRSVTTANIAYQMALAGRDVCVVDLDLTSPTYGAIVGLTDISAGAREGMHGLLAKEGSARSGTDPLQLTRNVWEVQNKDVAEDRRKADAVGRFDLLPGQRPPYPAMLAGQALGERITEIVRLLQQQRGYDAIFLDARSGLSDVVHALLSTDVVDEYLIFHRWTRQHVAGALQQIGGPARAGRRIAAVRTADLTEGRFSGNATWFHDRDGELRDEWQEGLAALRRKLNRPLQLRQLRPVPLEPSLQVQERLLTSQDVRRGIAAETTVRAYQALEKEL